MHVDPLTLGPVHPLTYSPSDPIPSDLLIEHSQWMGAVCSCPLVCRAPCLLGPPQAEGSSDYEKR